MESELYKNLIVKVETIVTERLVLLDPLHMKSS